MVVETEKVQQIVELEKHTKDEEMESTEEKPDGVAAEKKDVESMGLEDNSVVLVEDGKDPEKGADEKPDVDMEIVESSG